MAHPSDFRRVAGVACDGLQALVFRVQHLERTTRGMAAGRIDPCAAQDLERTVNALEQLAERAVKGLDDLLLIKEQLEANQELAA